MVAGYKTRNWPGTDAASDDLRQTDRGIKQKQLWRRTINRRFYPKTCCQSMPNHGAKARTTDPDSHRHGVGVGFALSPATLPASCAAAQPYLAYT